MAVGGSEGRDGGGFDFGNAEQKVKLGQREFGEGKTKNAKRLFREFQFGARAQRMDDVDDEACGRHKGKEGGKGRK